MRIFFSAGDPSGDVHAAQVVRSLYRHWPGVQIAGYGGSAMEEAGCRLEYRLTDLAVMGFVKVLPHLPRFYHLARRTRRRFQQDPPDAVVLVDFPGFNWWVARYARQAGIPVFYYLPPQLWAWAGHRVERMRRLVDHVLCAFPFEPGWYAARGVEAEYVGHPVFDSVASQPLDESFLAGQRAQRSQVVGILPGSRDQEVRVHWPIQLAVMEGLARRVPGTRFLVANYTERQRRLCHEMLERSNLSLPVELHVGRTPEIIELADAGVSVSGSVSLELLARATPSVMIYRSGWVFSWFCRHVVDCPYMSLPNLFAQRMLLPEYYVVGPPRTYEGQIVDQLAWWLTDSEERTRRKDALVQLSREVCVGAAADRAAHAICRRLAGAAA